MISVWYNLLMLLVENRKMRSFIIIRSLLIRRKYYGCENNPECDFMSWQKPSEKKCPKCGGYMLEKGNKLVCADEQCGYVEQKSSDN